MKAEIVETALYWNTPFIARAENLRSALICLGSLGVRVDKCRVNADSVHIVVHEFPADIDQSKISELHEYLCVEWNSVMLYKFRHQQYEVHSHE